MATATLNPVVKSNVKRTSPKSNPAPKGLFLFGTDNRIYSVDVEGKLTEVLQDDKAVVHGRGVSRASVSGAVPAPSEEGDVQARHFDNYYGWHTFIMWGWILDESYCWIYVRHYHPYGSEFAVYFS